MRVPELEPVLTAWALIDCSPSMRFGSLRETKLDLARETLAGIGTVLRRRGDRLGVVATSHGDLDLVRPPRGDRRGLAAALAAIDAVPERPGTERTDLARAVRALGRLARHRGAVFILSDFPPGPGLERAIGMLGRSHEVFAIDIRDRRERELPAVGTLTLRDVETGRTVTVDTGDAAFRDRLAATAAAAAEERHAMLARAGARHVVVETGSDWVLALARMLEGPGRRVVA